MPPKGLAVNVRKNKLASLAALGFAAGIALTACWRQRQRGHQRCLDAGGAAAGGSGYAELEPEPRRRRRLLHGHAQTAWTETFKGLVQAEGGDITVTYDPTGSGTGRASSSSPAR